MLNLPIILFLLGVVFLYLGWRWQSPPNEEAMTALKGLAYLKREILRVQDQVHVLEDKIQIAQQNEIKASEHRDVEHRDVERREVELRELGLRERGLRELDLRELDLRELERKEKIILYSLKTKEQRERASGLVLTRNISPKYQEVLDLAVNGHSIPEIAEHLLLSQDAVRMVLNTQTKGVAR